MLFRAFSLFLLISATTFALDVEYGTFIGGNQREAPSAVWGDATGRALVVGETNSDNLPVTPGAVKSRCGFEDCGRRLGGDLFVGRLSADGSEWEYLTYLGGSERETAVAIRGDALGNSLVLGTTDSADFPFTGELFGPAAEDRNAFAVKLTPSGTRIAFALPIPGLQPTDADLDAAGNLWILGLGAAGLPTTENAPQREARTDPAPYVAVIDPSGTQLLFATYWGGSRGELPRAIRAHGGGATICGRATSANFPTTPGAIKDQDVLPDVFAARFGLGGEVVYSTRFGGSDDESLQQCVIDAQGGVHFTGATRSLDFPWTTGEPDSPSQGGGARFYTRLSPDGSLAEQVSHLTHGITSMAVDPASGVYFYGAPTGGASPSRVFALDGSGRLVSLTDLWGYARSFSAPTALASDVLGNLYAFGIANSSAPQTVTSESAVQGRPGGDLDLLLTKLPQRAPRLTVIPETLDFRGGASASLGLPLYVATASPSQAVVPIAIRAGASWVLPPRYGSPGPSAGPEILGEWREVTIRAEAPSSDPGVYESELFVEAAGLEPIRVPVRYHVPASASLQTALRGEYTIGTPPLVYPEGAFRFPNSPERSTQYELSQPWLQIVPVRDYNPYDVRVVIDPTGLPPGSHFGEIVVRQVSPDTVDVVPVLLTVRTPRMTLTPSSAHLVTDAASGESAHAEVLVDLPRVGSDRPTLGVAAVGADAPWLHVQQLDETLPGRFALMANPEGLAQGRHTATVTIQTVEPLASLEVPVAFDVLPNASLTVNPSSLAFKVPSPEMLVGMREIRLESAQPMEFRVERRIRLGRVGTLIVDPLEGVTPATIRVSLQAGRSDEGGGAEISILAGGSSIPVPVGLSMRPLEPQLSAVTNAASFDAGYISPGALASVFGEQFTWAEWRPESLPIRAPFGTPTIAVYGGDGQREFATSLYTSPGQLNVQIPEVAPGRGRIQLGETALEVEIREASPGIFLFNGERAVVQNQDGSLNTAQNGAAPGEVGVLYLTGQGPLDVPVQPGHAAPSGPLARATLSVELQVDGRPVDVLFAGLTPGFVGLCQVNFRFPDLPPGDYRIRIRFGSFESNEAMVTIR